MAVTNYTVVNGEVLSENRTGTKRDYVPDPLGSTVALLDNTQTQTDTFTYWPYGENRTRTGTTATPFQFVGTLGYYRDSASRTYVRARTLRTDQGRWLTEDKIQMLQGYASLFAYALDHPTRLVDPSGLLPRCFWECTVGGLIWCIWCLTHPPGKPGHVDIGEKIRECESDCLKEIKDFPECFRKCMGSSFTQHACETYGCSLPKSIYTCPSYGNPCSKKTCYPLPRAQCHDCCDLSRICCQVATPTANADCNIKYYGCIATCDAKYGGGKGEGGD